MWEIGLVFLFLKKLISFKEKYVGAAIGNNFFTIKILKHWNRLPRELVAAPSLETFKVSLDGALSNLIKL